MRLVEVDLGPVFCNLVRSHRSAPSFPAAFTNGQENILSREEGAVQCVDFSSGEHRPERSENGAELVEKSPGPYVIPGQSLTGEINAQKIGNKLIFEWSAEKCGAELC